MEQNSSDAAAKAVAFANGLRRSISASGRRWTQWPGGANDLAVVLGCIDAIALRLRAVPAQAGDAGVAACIADLRAVLEWATYQSASVATARALLVARKTVRSQNGWACSTIPRRVYRSWSIPKNR
jgi:hypothetical protein